MSSDAATPATPAADDRVPEPRSGPGPVAVPDTTTDATDTTDTATDATTTPEGTDPPRSGSTTGSAGETTTEPAAEADAGDQADEAAETSDDTTMTAVESAENADAVIAVPAQTRSETVPDAVEAPAAPATPVAPAAAPGERREPPHGGRLTARMREARSRLEPERTVIPEPRSPEGVVPPAAFAGGSAKPAKDLVSSLEDLHAAVAETEESPEAPERRALVRVLELSAAGVPDAGWSSQERVDAETLAGAAAVAGTLLASAEAVLERLDADGRAASAVEVDAVVTSLRVARMVLDLESFDRHGL
ncbi:hypothetical protein ACR9E3_30980 [Actinomycetospora sp. C-140]